MMLSYQTSLYILGFVYFITIKNKTKQNPRRRVQNTVGVSVPATQVPGDGDSFLQADTSHPRLKARTCHPLLKSEGCVTAMTSAAVTGISGAFGGPRPTQEMDAVSCLTWKEPPGLLF